MIRIRFFGPGELNQKGFRAARYSEELSSIVNHWHTGLVHGQGRCARHTVAHLTSFQQPEATTQLVRARSWTRAWPQVSRALQMQAVGGTFLKRCVCGLSLLWLFLLSWTGLMAAALLHTQDSCFAPRLQFFTEGTAQETHPRSRIAMCLPLKFAISSQALRGIFFFLESCEAAGLPCLWPSKRPGTAHIRFFLSCV